MTLASLRSKTRAGFALLALLALAPSAFGALSAFQIWEIRQAGSASNGGGFRHNPFQAAPSSPTITGSGTGGTIAAGTYYCVITYTPAVGGETEISSQQSVVLSGATSSFTATHPSDPGNSTTWSLYVATATGGPYFPQGTALAIGSNRVVTTTPPTSGTQPPGVDRTLSTSPTVAIDNAAITTSITTSVITFTGGYTPTGADVGNCVKMLTGTNVTVQWCEITAITSTTWTVDKNVVTSGTTTNATGNMGGAVDHPGTIGGIAATGNTLFIKYSATAYTFGSGGSNTSGGTVTFSQSALTLCGYDTTRTYNNTDANRPIFNPTANSLTLFNSNAEIKYLNLDFVNTTPRTGTTGVVLGGNNLIKNCRFNTYQQFALQMGGGVAVDCEFISCGSANVCLYMPAESVAIRCIFKSCSTAGASTCVVLAGSVGILIDCWSVGATGTGAAFNGGVFLRGCAAVGGGGYGFLSALGTQYERCVAYNNTLWGFTHGSVARTNRYVQCATGANGSGSFDPASFGPDQIIGAITLTGDPFTNSAGYDLSTNNTAGAGAALRALTVTFPGGTTTSRPDAGPAQAAPTSTSGAGKKAGPGGGRVGMLDRPRPYRLLRKAG